jgi:PAS domain S-box-containing protein
VGFVSIERPLSAASGAALVERLLGSDATLKFGNTAGDLWTDLSAPVRAPPPAAPTSGAISFVAVPGDLRMGRSVAVAGTPWDVWVDFSEASLMEPARILLWRLLPSTLLLIVLGVVAVGSVSARITRPLQIVAEAADAIASGDYSRRVDVEGRDEVARLGSAFNLMATRFAESHDALEARVQARTAELERAREELDQFFSMSPDLLCIADKKGQFTRVNPAWEQALGWTAAELTSVPFLDLVHPDDAESTARETAMVANGGAASNFENRYRTKDGSYRWLSWKAAGRLDGGPMYAAARDVTEQKRAARELHHYAAELTAANHELEAFSYSVSHDLRSPLRSIDGFSQALLEDCGDQLGAEGEGHLRRIRAAAQHMGQLIDDLLKLARVTRADLRFQRIDLSAMAEAKLRALAVAEPDRTVEWRVAPGLHTVGDARLLEVAMTNLIENAWKFTGRCEEARIEFGATDGKGRREYFVKDNGAGFEAAYAGKLFGAFQRLHHANEFQGTGIGLATVQRILTRHGGHIRAEGAVGHGATFWFTLQPESRV